MDKMTKEQAAELLKNYQQWRKGRVDYFPVSPAKLSQAIEVAIEHLNSEADTADAEFFCYQEMDENLFKAIKRFGKDWTGNENHIFAMMADFANSRNNGK